ncbi:MAG: universal stress protein [Anaerolineae bacterium]|nr:universal stress protein [Candidatus Roseilinea sp.]MDW8451381.1 universal stress protein [Anaerolineae bacterium]
MYTKILVPLDGSELSNAVLPHVRQVARCSCASAILLRALPEPAPGVNGLSKAMLERQVVAHMPPAHDAIAGHGQPGVAHSATQAIRPDLVEREIEAYKFLDGIAAELSQSGIPVRTRVVIAEPDEAILDVAAEEGADLIAMATHGRGGISRFLLGSVADRVVRHAHAPVLLVRPAGHRAGSSQELPAYRRILVPLDGSELAHTVLPYVRKLAACTGAEVLLMQAVPEPEPEVIMTHAQFGWGRAMSGSIVSGSGDLARWIEHATAAARDSLDAAAAVLAESGIRVETTVSVGRPAEAILDMAERRGVDLIAMATHGYGGIRRFLIGSVADRIVRHAHAPVLLVRPHP